MQAQGGWAGLQNDGAIIWGIYFMAKCYTMERAITIHHLLLNQINFYCTSLARIETGFITNEVLLYLQQKRPST